MAGVTVRQCLTSSLVWLAIGAPFVGCTGASPVEGAEAPGQQHQALQIAVSGPFEVEASPSAFAVGSIDEQELVCGTGRCMLFYEQHLYGVNYLFASRVGSDGSILDFPRLLLGPCTFLRTAGALGDEFIVSYTPSEPGNPILPARTLRIQGSDLSVEDVSSVIGDAPEQILGGATNWVAIQSGQVAVLDAQDLQPLAPAFDLTVVPGARRLFRGDGQYLVTWPGHAARVDATIGMVLDSPPIEFSRYTTGDTHAVLVNGVYQLAWRSGQDVYGSRITAANGTVLDADDTFNQVSGATLLCDECTPDSLYLGTAGGDALALWTHAPTLGNWRLYASRINVSTGERRQGNNSAAELDVGAHGSAHLVESAGGSLLLGGTVVTGLDIVAAPFDVNLGESHAFGIETAERHSPALAYNGSRFLLAYVVGTAVLATRLDASTGEYLDDPPLQLGFGSTPVVSAVGSDFVVAWQDFDDGLDRRVVHDDGSVGAVVAPTIAGGETYDDAEDLVVSNLRLIGNGKYHLLTWLRDTEFSREYRGVRLDANGAAVGTVVPFMVARQLTYTTLADSTPAESMRTFLIVSDHEGDVIARRFRSESGALISETTTIGQGRLSLGVSDGTNLQVIYRSQDLDLASSFVDPASGNPTAGSPQLLWDAPQSVGVTFDALHDGVSILTFHNVGDYAALHLSFAVRRFAADRSPLDAEVGGWGTPIVSGLHRDHTTSAVASNGQGRTLIVYPMLDLDRLGMVLKGRFLDNDGLPTPPEPVGGGGEGGGDDGAAGAPPGEGGNGAGGEEVGGRGPGAAGEGSADAGQGGTGANSAGTAGGGKSGNAATGGMGRGGAAASGAGGAPAATSEGGCGCSVPSTRRNWFGSGLAILLLALWRARRTLGPPTN